MSENGGPEATAGGARPPLDEGGDSACWLSRVCPECGLFAEDEPPAVCARCGARVPAADDDGGAR